MHKLFQFNEFIELGKVFSDCEAYLIALEYFDKAIALSYLPINKERLAEAYDLRGGVKVFLRRYLESIFDYSKAIELDPNNSYLYFGRGMSYEYLNQNEEALKNLKMSLALDPDFSLALSMVDYLENEKK
jgi:tetratricopeptide (TPR) repeat protein